MSWRLALGARNSIVLLQDLCNTLLHDASLLSNAQAVKEFLRDAKPRINLICKEASRLQLRLVAESLVIERPLVRLVLQRVDFNRFLLDML
jgi:hypothetical protein